MVFVYCLDIIGCSKIIKKDFGTNKILESSLCLLFLVSEPQTVCNAGFFVFNFLAFMFGGKWRILSKKNPAKINLQDF